MINTGHPVLAAEDYARKIRAACMARTDPDFVICARTDAAHDLGLQEAIRRARMAHEVGADMIDIACPGTREEVAQISAAKLPIPLKGNMDEGKRLWEQSAEVLAEAGFKILSHPGLLRYTVVGAAIRALDHLKRHGNTIGIRDQMATVNEYFQAVDLQRYLDLEKQIL